MLVLSRKQSQQVFIGKDISITIAKIDGNQVRIGIEAPRGISILRAELVEGLGDFGNGGEIGGRSPRRPCLATANST
jgi:carbon storage regulator